MSGVQARRPPSLCQRAPPPFLLDSSLHSTHLCTHSSLHSTTCTPTHHFTPHTCAPTHHFQLFPMCGLFMHLSPVPLPAEITSTRTHMCMYVCSLYFLLYRLHSVSCSRDTSTMLPSGVSRCRLLFCFCLLAFDLIKRRSLPAFGPRSPIFSTLRRDRN